MGECYAARVIGVFTVTNGTLAATGGANATKIAFANKDRVALEIENVGTGDGFGTFDPTRTAADVGNKRIRPDGIWAPGTAPIAPQNATYAVGDAGCILVVTEIVRVRPEDLGQ